MRTVYIVLTVWLAACGGGATDGAGGGDSNDNGTGSGGGSTGTAPVAGEDSSVAGIVAAHNAARAAVQPAPATPLPALTWSSAAFEKARAWAASCRFDHNPALGGFGENIYATTGTTTAQEVVGTWVGEKSRYDYASNTSSGTTGHYTQVVWRATTAVGCAAQVCTSGSPFGGGSWQLWVCDYSPAGNSGGRPY